VLEGTILHYFAALLRATLKEKESSTWKSHRTVKSHHPARVRPPPTPNKPEIMTLSAGETPPHPRDAVIVQAIRTPLCRARKGGLAKIPPSVLLASVLRGVILKNPQQTKAEPDDGDYLIPPDSVQDICVGNVLSPPTAAVSFRMAALSSGIPHTTSLSTTNRQCSSGLQAIANIAFAIQTGSINVGIGENYSIIIGTCCTSL
jgi:hypothetical protein